MPERRSLWRVGPESTWTTILPVAFIIASLLSLVALPVVVARHTNQMRLEISNLAEPARRAANQIQMDLANEIDKINSFQVTGQNQYRDEYVALLERQETNRAALAQLAARLGGGLDQNLNVLMVHAGRWHEGVRQGELLSRQLPAEVLMTRLFERHPAYEKALVAASELELAMQGAIEQRLQRMRAADQWSRWLTIILTLLALTSAMLVAGLGRQMRLLAREAMRRRQDAEREAIDARNARAAAEREERRSAFLATAGQELASSLDYEETIAMLSRLIVPNLAEFAVVDILEPDGKNVPESLMRIMRDRETRLIDPDGDLLEYVTGRGAPGNRTLIAAPLVTRGETFGIVLAVSKETKPFTPDDVTLFTELARHAALAIDNARLYLDSQRAVRAREDVLAIVSHDLRNPLNAVILAGQLLETSDRISGEDREQVEAISVSSRRMTRLIADLLDVTRLEGGKQLPIEPASVEVKSLLNEAQEIFKSQAAAASVTLQIHRAEALPQIHADRHRVMQVLSNLIGNSLKFTPSGGLISVRAEKGDPGVVRFVVTDSGPGIPDENLPHIFDRYWQEKRTERMGAGLGLAIARGIVEAHGGQIWAESKPGEGARFYFTMPVANESAAVPLEGPVEEHVGGVRSDNPR